MAAAQSRESRRIITRHLLRIKIVLKCGKQRLGQKGSARRDCHSVKKIAASDPAIHSQRLVAQLLVGYTAITVIAIRIQIFQVSHVSLAHHNDTTSATRETLHDPLGLPVSSTFLTANSAPWNPTLLWVPSQNGLFTDPPQRQSENAGLPVRSYLLPSASTSSTEPSAASTRYGPFFLTVILTAGICPPD